MRLRPRLWLPCGAHATPRFAFRSMAFREKRRGICIADGTRLSVGANHRIGRNRAFKGAGCSRMRRFAGFRLYVVMNHYCKLMAIKITPGNAWDCAPLTNMVASRGAGRRVAGRQGLHLGETLRSAMVSGAAPDHGDPPEHEKLPYACSEYDIDAWKPCSTSSDPRWGSNNPGHRSPAIALVDILSCLTACALEKTKPERRTSPVNNSG